MGELVRGEKQTHQHTHTQPSVFLASGREVKKIENATYSTEVVERQKQQKRTKDTQSNRNVEVEGMKTATAT
jgi:hypothetical protein